MKKIIAILLFMTMLISLTGCSTVEHLPDRAEEPAEPAETRFTPSPVPEQESDGDALSEVPREQYQPPEATPEPEPASLTGYAATADMIFEITGAMQKTVKDLTLENPHAPAGFGDPVNSQYKMFTSFF